jgi:subtilisin
MTTETIYRGPNAWTRAVATVTVLDADGLPVEGATVYGHWSGLTSGDVSGTTDANGQVTFKSSLVKNASGTFTFTVDDIVKEGYTYDPSANKETSDSITV